MLWDKVGIVFSASMAVCGLGSIHASLHMNENIIGLQPFFKLTQINSSSCQNWHQGGRSGLSSFILQTACLVFVCPYEPLCERNHTLLLHPMGISRTSAQILEVHNRQSFLHKFSKLDSAQPFSCFQNICKLWIPNFWHTLLSRSSSSRLWDWWWTGHWPLKAADGATNSVKASWLLRPSQG